MFHTLIEQAEEDEESKDFSSVNMSFNMLASSQKNILTQSTRNQLAAINSINKRSFIFQEEDD